MLTRKVLRMSFEPIHWMVKRATASYPDRNAVECPDGVLTYAELDSRSDSVARTLLAAGAGPGSVIPIIADDHRDVIAAILGVLKINAVFVPLDPNGPPQGAFHVLRSLAPEYVVQGPSNGGETMVGSSPRPVTVIAMDRLVSGGDLPSMTTPDPDAECYIFFTSGSTGVPKGIVGRLGAVDHYVRWEIDLLGAGPHWRVSQLTSPAFDAILRDIFVPLSIGGTACAPPTGALQNPRDLVRWIDTQQINLVHCVPSVFRSMVSATSPTSMPLETLRCVALAGERLAPRDVRLWFDQYGDRIRILNLYGPSETTMTKMYHVVERGDGESSSVPIGTPMADTDVLLIDDAKQFCQQGDIGEIHIRTPYRSHGYFRQAKATKEAFIPNPVSGDEMDILYRTGDYGRMRSDGKMEFLGRRDHQVKIGGIRVEVEEMESVLRELPSVNDAVVCLADRTDVPYLCAFVELSGAIDEPMMRHHLLSRYPNSVVPAVFVRLKEIPRTISGKVDRRGLPAVPRPASGTPVAPRTSTERALATIVRDIFPVTEVDVQADLLEAGGNSLLIMRLLARVNEELGAELPLQAVLASPTVESLAGRIESVMNRTDSEASRAQVR
jgi:amino acid adenylation domain-containing protein